MICSIDDGSDSVHASMILRGKTTACAPRGVPRESTLKRHLRDGPADAALVERVERRVRDLVAVEQPAQVDDRLEADEHHRNLRRDLMAVMVRIRSMKGGCSQQGTLPGYSRRGTHIWGSHRGTHATVGHSPKPMVRSTP